MYNQTVTLVILCVLLGCIWSVTSGRGQHPWCQSDSLGQKYLSQNDTCCTEKYDCEVFIKPHGKGHGVKNNSNRTLRACPCNLQFSNCMMARVSYRKGVEIFFHFIRQNCLIPSPCESNKTCDKKFDIVNYGNWVNKEAEKYQK